MDAISEQEQVAIWFESLSADQRAAVLSIDPDDDVPGWMVAGLIAAHDAMKADPAAPDPTDFKSRVPQVLQEFVRRVQAEQ